MASRERGGAPASPKEHRLSSHHFRFETKIFLLALGSSASAIAIAIALLWHRDYSSATRWLLAVSAFVPALVFAWLARAAILRPLRTLAAMHAAVREGDYSVRVRAGRVDDSLGELLFELNQLSDKLQAQRLSALESSALLSTVVAEIDVAVLTFDGERRLRLLNRAGERLIGRTVERSIGLTATELGVADLLEGEQARTLDREFAGRTGRYGMRRKEFRQRGAKHYLVVVADLSRALREEERAAWQRLVRVLGHELNNSLAPVKSIAESLETMMNRNPRSADWEDDLRGGLKIISERAESLTRFMRDYGRLARLPQPRVSDVQVAPLLRRVAKLEQRVPVRLEDGPEITVRADGDQLEQLLVNVVRNAADACLETGGEVILRWTVDDGCWDVFVLDEGTGLANPANLFIPFFSTKQGGSGIGLALSRQIAEAHGGSVSLRNRENTRGAVFHLHLPVSNQ